MYSESNTKEHLWTKKIPMLWVLWSACASDEGNSITITTSGSSLFRDSLFYCLQDTSMSFEFQPTKKFDLPIIHLLHTHITLHANQQTVLPLFTCTASRLYEGVLFLLGKDSMENKNELELSLSHSISLSLFLCLYPSVCLSLHMTNRLSSSSRLA